LALQVIGAMAPGGPLRPKICCPIHPSEDVKRRDNQAASFSGSYSLFKCPCYDSRITLECLSAILQGCSKARE